MNWREIIGGEQDRPVLGILLIGVGIVGIVILANSDFMTIWSSLR